MSPKEKSKELVDKFIPMTKDWDELEGFIVNINNAKQCALIAVDECIKTAAYMPETLHFWNQVKQEIEKL